MAGRSAGRRRCPARCAGGSDRRSYAVTPGGCRESGRGRSATDGERGACVSTSTTSPRRRYVFFNVCDQRACGHPEALRLAWRGWANRRGSGLTARVTGGDGLARIGLLASVVCGTFCALLAAPCALAGRAAAAGPISRDSTRCQVQRAWMVLPCTRSMRWPVRSGWPHRMHTRVRAAPASKSSSSSAISDAVGGRLASSRRGGDIGRAITVSASQPPV